VIEEVPRRFRPRKRREPLSGFEKAVLAVLGIAVAIPMVVFGIVPLVKLFVADQGLDDRGARVVGVVDSVDPQGSVKHERMKYHYTVDGRTYHGSGNFTDPDMVGRDIKLIYDPENPGNSEVDRSRPAAAKPAQGSGGLWGFAVCVVAMVAAYLWYLRRQPWWIKRQRRRRT
jgi:uncharacterized protein DUF3592